MRNKSYRNIFLYNILFVKISWIYPKEFLHLYARHCMYFVRSSHKFVIYKNVKN